MFGWLELPKTTVITVFSLCFVNVMALTKSSPTGSPDAILQTLGCVIYSNDGSLWPVYTSLIALQTGDLAEHITVVPY